MTKCEKHIASLMLSIAADSFSNHGCNDWDWPENIPQAEREAFVKAYHEWNGDPEEFDSRHLFLPDSSVMAYLSARLMTDDD